MNTALYRHFAADGSLLYVGISLSWPARTRAHAHRSVWFEQVARVEIERFPTREAALDAERAAIRSERPKFNVAHNKASEPRVAAPGARRRLSLVKGDPLLEAIKGPDAIVGPALVYRDDLISVMVAHGEFGTSGELTEVELGEFFDDELPEWSHLCASVITLRRATDITIAEARDARDEIVQKLRRHLRAVEAFGTDIALAVAYASRFPSAKSRQLLDEIAVERRVAA